MGQITSGWTYEPSGIKSEVTAENLNAHVNNAQLVGGAIDEQDTNSLTADTDNLLITKGGTIFRQTKGQFTHTINANTVNAVNLNGGAMVPIGGIIMWSGTEAALPANWKVCDGTNGTPDLRGKFVRGGNVANPSGTTGGADSTTLTGLMVPEHQHQFRIRQLDYIEIFGSSTLTVWDVYPQWDENPIVNTQTRLTGPASVGGNTNPTPVPTVPAFYALAYIMRVS